MKKTALRRIISSFSSVLVMASAMPLGSIPVSAANETVTIIYGDANNDGEVRLSDAVLIMQSIGNPDVYGINGTSPTHITKKGIELADVYNRGDGLTNQDALAVQKYLIHLLSELPESWQDEPVTSETLIHFKGTSVEVEGDNAEVNGTTVTITHSGTFIVDGTLDDGQIAVAVPDETTDPETVKIFLNGVNITGKNAPAIYISNAENTSINLIDGTENNIQDGDTAYSGDWLGAAVIEAKDDITIKGGELGTGVLNITANTQNAVVCNNDIKFTGGTTNIKTLNSVDKTNGVNGKTSATIKGTAVVNIDAEGDGFKSSKGNVSVEGGTAVIKAGNDAVQSGTTIDISGGSLTAGGDRGLTSVSGVNITGGMVVATATDNQTDTALLTSSQVTMLFNCVDCPDNTDLMWKKANSFILADQNIQCSFTKKYKYVLISSPELAQGTDVTITNAATNASVVYGADKLANFTAKANINVFEDVDPVYSTIIPPVVNPSSDYTVTLDSASIMSNAPAETASVNGSVLTITQPGAFAVSGAAKNVQIVVDVDKTAYPTGVVELNLAGADISNSTTAPIFINSIGDEVQIAAKNGTENVISDGTVHIQTYTDADGNVNTVEGAVFARDDIKFKGKGNLTINGNTDDAVVCKNDVKIYNGNITVNAVDDGIRGKDSVTVGNANDTDYSALNITIKTQSGDGIKSTATDASAGDKSYGIVTVNGGKLDINSYADGIQGEQDVVINGGDISIYTYQGSAFTGSGNSSNQTNPWGGGIGGGMQDGNPNKTDISAKGIKAVGIYDTAGTSWQSRGNITVNGGNITIDSSDDSLHCGGDMNLYGGVMQLSTADDGVHSDHKVTIGKGSADTYDDVKIIVIKGYEGIEGMNIVQNSGTVICNTTDDAYNAAGGADNSGNGNNTGGGQGGWGGGIGGGSASVSYSLDIKGGFALANVTDGDHDGFDSNGSLTISGGIVISNGNEAFDSDGAKSCTGGIFIENTGSGGMGGGMGGGSLTASVSATGSVSKGTRISLVGSDNQVIVSFIAGKSVSNFKAGGSGVPSGASFYTGGTLSGFTYFQEQYQDQLAAYGGTLTGGNLISGGSGSIR